jgi:quinoprotein glucose dehydrogenase
MVPILLLVALAACGEQSAPRSVPASGYRQWQDYGGGKDGLRYSALGQITTENAGQLEVAWVHETGDAFAGSELQCNPIVIGRSLYATTPKLRVIALDAATGELQWTFDPFDGQNPRRSRNRGVAYWADQTGDQARILFTARQFLYCLDAATGLLHTDFGEGGRVNLRQGLGRDVEGLTVECSTPGTIYGDLLILGSTVGESLPAAPGHIRAYDVRTGEIRWAFATIPRPGEYGADTWPEGASEYIGGANCWAGMALDEERGLLFVPTGSPAFDFYGGNRVGDNLFANSLICLRAATGERLWHFQIVKHDIWDRDLPAPPSLVTVERNGTLVDAVAQITKSGHVFVFHRETGEPLFPTEERTVPGSEVPGEVPARTQTFPVRPPPFARQRLTPEEVTDRTVPARQAVLERLATLRSEGQFTPLSEGGTVVFPGLDGGGEWGGAAFDPESGLLYVNANEMAWVLKLVERESFGRTTSRQLYLAHCASCHRADLRGTPPEFPSLLDIDSRYTAESLTDLARSGAGRMTGHPHLTGDELMAISRYLVEEEDLRVTVSTPISRSHLRYRIDGYNKFLDPDGYPAVKPPWGTLTAIDLDRGELRWQIPLGEIPELVAQGMENTGSENYGGPLVTAGGLLFIGATNHDRKFRAFHKGTGELLWEYVLPAAGNATPATYMVDGRQFVVIAAGGGKWGNPSGGQYIAFALR